MWSDLWLLRESDHIVRSPCIKGMEEMRACELLNKDLISWNEGMARGIFVEEEVEEILTSN